MFRASVIIVIVAAIAIVVTVYLLLHFYITQKSSSSSSLSSSSSSSSTLTTCTITCPPGYSVNPLICTCSPLVPANIVVQPSPTFNIPLWLAVGVKGDNDICYLQNEGINIGKACMGVLSSSCCPSTAPPCPCSLCDKSYGCNPETAQTSGTVSFYATVVSSNGTPIPNTTVNVKSPLPQTYDLPIPSSLGQVGTVKLTLMPPSQSVSTDSNGNATILVPFTAKLTSFNFLLADLQLASGQFCAYTDTFTLQFDLSIPDTAIVVPAIVKTNISLCVNFA